jgi:2-hydroxy-3-oxopropionate reductase
MNTAQPIGIVGFIGLGTMGREMARNLLAAGFGVRGYDVLAHEAAALAAAGGVAAGSVAEAAAGADAVIAMLPDTPQVEAVVLGPGGLAEHPPAGRLVIDMSTIAPTAVRRMHAALKARGIGFVDAPVSGGQVGAKSGRLSIMAGGDAGDFARARPYFAAMGTTIAHVGATGAGQTVKLCNQLIGAQTIMAICEALALGRAAGVDLEQLHTVLLGGTAGSWMLEHLGPAMIAGTAPGGFRIDLMFKDLRLVQEMAQAFDVPLPGAALATSLYVSARAHGEGGNGNQALFRVYDRLANQRRDPVSG